jgi:hypothetical protein
MSAPTPRRGATAFPAEVHAVTDAAQDALFHIFPGDVEGRPVVPGERSLCGQPYTSTRDSHPPGPARPDDCVVCMDLYAATLDRGAA